MFEFLFSIRASFLAVRVGRMPCRCAATQTNTAKEEKDFIFWEAYDLRKSHKIFGKRITSKFT